MERGRRSSDVVVEVADKTRKETRPEVCRARGRRLLRMLMTVILSMEVVDG